MFAALQRTLSRQVEFRTRASSVCLAALAALACSSGEEGADGGQVPPVGGAAGSAGLAGSGGAATGGESAGGGAGASGMGGAGAAAMVTPLNLKPLAVGNTWTYDVVDSAAVPACELGVHETRIDATMEILGRTAYVERFFCSPAGGPTFLSVSDGQIDQVAGDEWRPQLAAPVEDGAAWQFAPNVTLRYRRAGTITVPAGTFDDCWERIRDGAAQVVTYCKDVGLVRQELDTSVAELTEFSVR